MKIGKITEDGRVEAAVLPLSSISPEADDPVETVSFHSLVWDSGISQFGLG